MLVGLECVEIRLITRSKNRNTGGFWRQKINVSSSLPKICTSAKNKTSLYIKRSIASTTNVHSSKGIKEGIISVSPTETIDKAIRTHH